MTGKVKWFNAEKGYGFIIVDDSEVEVFAHYSQIQTDEEYKTLSTDDLVEFEVEETEKGKQANNIRLI